MIHYHYKIFFASEDHYHWSEQYYLRFHYPVVSLFCGEGHYTGSDVHHPVLTVCREGWYWYSYNY